MSRTQGTARQEAERLVATVLAMASQAGGSSGGFGALGDAVLGLVGHATGAGSSGAGSSGAGSSGAGSSGAANSGTASSDAAGPGAASSGGTGWATGSAECCICPICKTIAGLRDPDPEFAERLATGAGDFASGVASLLRAFSPADAGAEHADAGEPTPARRATDDPWAAATASGYDPTATVPRQSAPAAPLPPMAKPPAAKPATAGDTDGPAPAATHPEG